MTRGVEIKSRKDIEEKYRWDLESVYQNDETWEEDFKKIEILSEEIEGYKGHVGESGETLLEVLNLQSKIFRNMDNVFTYARMRQDEDNNNTFYQTLSDKAASLKAKVDSCVSFIIPEILSIDREKLGEYIQAVDGMKLYEFYLDQIIRKKEHMLSVEEESILAQIGELANSPNNIFSKFNNADITFPTIENENLEKVEISHGRLRPLLENRNRKVRKDAFNGFYSTYMKFKNTYASILGAEVKKNIIFSNIKKYNSAIEASLDSNNISVEVYKKLLEAVNSNLNLLHRYVKLKKEVLELDELHMYDLYTPIIRNIDMDIPYEKAKELILEGLKPLGEEYISIVDMGLKSRWIDVYENKGKSSGAYSWGTYDSKPFILMSYNNTFNSMSTLVHEIGHSLHSYYSRKNKPYIYSNYSSFVAEVASTTNEALLMNHLINNAQDKEEKLYLLYCYLEQFRGSFFRQALFAEFEKNIYEKAESGEVLTADNLCKTYRELNEKYYGPHIVVDEGISMEWAWIPQFYMNFYEYQYSTGFAAATALSQKILKEGKTAVDKYLEFLKSGGSDYSIGLLKKAGVDMTTTAPVNNSLKLFGQLLDQMETLIKEQ